MSTLVVVRKNNVAAIAADTMSSLGSTVLSEKYDANSSKILNYNQTYLGFVGYAATTNVFIDLFAKVPAEDPFLFGSTADIFDTLLRMHPVLKKEYFMMTEDDEEQPYESSQVDALLVNRNGIFGVHGYREVYEYRRFWATGSGWKFALGAMHAAYEGSANAEEIARAGIEAASEFDQGSGLPMESKSVMLDPAE